MFFFVVHKGIWVMYICTGTLRLAVLHSWGSIRGRLSFRNCLCMSRINRRFPCPTNSMAFFFFIRRHPVYLTHLLHCSCNLWINFHIFNKSTFWASLQFGKVANSSKEEPYHRELSRGRQSAKDSGLLVAIKNFFECYKVFVWSGNSFRAVLIVMFLVPPVLTVVK